MDVSRVPIINKYELDARPGSFITMRLYKNVKNFETLLRLRRDGEVFASFINAALIYDPFQVVVAANKVVSVTLPQTISYQKELLYNLSPSNNIKQSLQLFSANTDGNDLLAVVICTPNDKRPGKDVMDVFKRIDGEEIDLSRLGEVSDLERIRKVYNLSDEECKSDILGSIVTKISCKEHL